MYKKLILVTSISLCLLGCGGGGSESESKAPPATPQNKSPVANAGDDITTSEGQTVTLTSTSTDADGSIATYAWTQTSGPEVTLSDNSSKDVSFLAPDVSQDTTAEFRLTVTDDDGASSSDSVMVMINFVNQAPTITLASRDAVLYPYVETVISFSINDPDNNLTEPPAFTSPVNALEIISSDNDSVTVKLNDQPTELTPIPLSISATDTLGASTTLTENVDVEINLQISNIEIDGNRDDAGCAVTALGFDCWYNPDDQYPPTHIQRASEAFSTRTDIVNFYIMRGREVCVITDMGKIECVIGRYAIGDRLLSSQLETIPQHHYTDITFTDRNDFEMFLLHPYGVVTLFELENGDITVKEIKSDVKIKKIVYAKENWDGEYSDFVFLMEDNTLYCSETSSRTPTPCPLFDGVTVLDATRIMSSILLQTDKGASFVFLENPKNVDREYIKEQISTYFTTYFTGADFTFDKRAAFYNYDSWGGLIFFKQDGQWNRLSLRNIYSCFNPLSAELSHQRNCPFKDGVTGIHYNYPYKAVVKSTGGISECEISFNDRLVCYYRNGSPLYVPDYLKDHNY